MKNKKSQDPTEAALSAIEDALNIGKEAPEVAPPALEPERREVRRAARTQEPAGEVFAQRSRGTRERLPRPANDDRQSVGQILQALHRRPSSAPVVAALLGSIVWIIGGAAVAASQYRTDTGAVMRLSEIALQPTFLPTLAAILLPPLLFFMTAMLVRRSQELRHISRAMTEVTLRLAEPEGVSTDAVVSVSQAIRREVAALGDGIERAVARASELESMVRTEVATLERAYGDNEGRVRQLVSELQTERDAVLEHAGLIRDAIASAHEAFSFDVHNIADRVSGALDDATGRITDNILMRAEDARAQLLESANSVLDTLVEKSAEANEQLLKSGNSVVESLSDRSAEATQRLTEVGVEIAKAIADRNEKVSEALEQSTTDMHDKLMERAAGISQMIAESGQTFENTIGRQLQTLADNVATRGNEIAARVAIDASALGEKMSESVQTFETTVKVFGGNLVDEMRAAIEGVQEASREGLSSLDFRVSERVGEITDKIGQAASQFDDRIGRIETTLDERAQSLNEMLAARSLDVANSISEGSRAATEAVEKSVTGMGEYFAARTAEMAATLSDRAAKIDETLGNRAMQLTDTLDTRVNKFEELVVSRLENITGSIEQKGLASADLLVERVTSVNELLRGTAAHVERRLGETSANVQKHLGDTLMSVERQLGSTTTNLDEQIGTTAARVERHLSQTASELEKRLGTTASEVEKHLGHTASEVEKRLTTTSSEVERHLGTALVQVGKQLADTAAHVEKHIGDTASNAERHLTGLASNVEKRLTDSSEHVETRLTTTAANVEKQITDSSEHVETRLTATAASVEKQLTDTSAHVETRLNTTAASVEKQLGETSAHVERQLTATASSVEKQLGDTSANVERHLGDTAATVEKRVGDTSHVVERNLTALADGITENFIMRVNSITGAHETLRTEVRDILAELGQTHGLLQASIDTASSLLGPIEGRISEKVGAFNKTLESAMLATKTTSERMDGQIRQLTESSNSVLRDVSNLTLRFDEQVRLVAKTGETLNESHRLVDESLVKRREAIDQITALMTERTADMEERLTRFNKMLAETFEQTQAKAQDVARLVAESTATATQAIARQYELVRNASGEERERTTTALKDTYDEAMQTVNAMFAEANARFLEASKDLREISEDIQRTLDTTREEIRTTVFELPTETKESANAMRRVVADQIKALSELNEIVARHGRPAELAAPEAYDYREEEMVAVGGRASSRGALPRPRFEEDEAELPPAPLARKRGPVAVSPERKTVDRSARFDEALTQKTHEHDEPEEDATTGIESLDSLSIDIARMIDHEMAAEAWERYNRGEAGAFTRRLYTTAGQKTFEEIRKKYRRNDEFRDTVDRYIDEFEKLLEQVSRDERGQALTRTYLTSETGKVYTLLAHAAGRLS